MKPKLHTSLRVAQAVLRKIDLAEHVAKQATVTCYENGREHGLALRHISTTAAWAEARSSDQIVVYVGRTDEFEFAGAVPSERAYREAKYFPCGDFEKAARFIAKAVS